MPNWCANTVTFKHDDPEKIKDIVRAWNSGKFFSAFFPCPKELEDVAVGSAGDELSQQEKAAKEASNLRTYGYTNWYDWRVAEWGTKWDVGREEGRRRRVLKAGVKKVTLRFDSAWAPPVGFYEKMHDQHEYGIDAYFFEPGMGFCGSWRDGFVAEFSLSHIKTVNDLRATVPAKIINEFKIADMVAEEIEDT